MKNKQCFLSRLFRKKKSTHQQSVAPENSSNNTCEPKPTTPLSNEISNTSENKLEMTKCESEVDVKISREGRLCYYEKMEFTSVRQLASYLDKNGYPNISHTTVCNILNGKNSRKYPDLCSKITYK